MNKIMNKNLITKKEFLRQLGEQSKDLGETVQRIEEERKYAAKQKRQSEEFYANPYQTLPDGKKRFYVSSHIGGWVNVRELFEERSYNLLDYFTIEEIEALYDDQELSVNDNRDNSYFYPNDINHYHGPKIHLFPDSNIEINTQLRRTFRGMDGNDTIVYDVLTLPQIESRHGGIMRKFGRNIPDTLYRGQTSLEKRCQGMDDDKRVEITRFFNNVVEYFDREITVIRRLADENSNMRPIDIARKFFDNRGNDYVKLVKKEIENYKDGNLNNHITDRVITAASFGFNLVDGINKSVVISADSDLKCCFNIMYNEVLPRFMADAVFDMMKDKKTYVFRSPEIRNRMISAAKEHIEWAKSAFGDNSTVGILYSTREKRFHTFQVAAPFVDFFNGVNTYRHGKSEVLKRMVLTGKGAEEVVHDLMKREQDE